MTSSVSENQQEVVSNSETKSKIIVDAKAPAEVKTNASDKNKTNNPLELASNSAIIHPASSSVSVEESSIEKSDSDIHSEDSEYSILLFVKTILHLTKNFVKLKF